MSTTQTTSTQSQQSLRDDRLRGWLLDDGLEIQGRLLAGASSTAQHDTAASAKPAKPHRSRTGKKTDKKR
ncbi:hypothetical protein G7Z17_g3311 [Cylindrodendrum hubeiense]|uniref:Uncharacterized protein n=1 Tax=Cylindrodendrum hubeiense TaxID=595255 RepID=A0A9P5LIB7_9HYPO|nr:hypothetical protein G7Z17_g3311 [Cylindrodendrum hubeiense]